jgi:hypothetical protein
MISERTDTAQAKSSSCPSDALGSQTVWESV